MKINYLPWDSDFFEMKIGKVDINELEKFESSEFLKNAKKENYNLVYVFKYGKILNQQDINAANLELVDIMLTMSKKFDKKQYKDTKYDFRTKLSKKELEECYYIAEQTSIVSRFYKEKTIGEEKTKELYRKWIDNTLDGIYSDGLFLFKDSETVAGIYVIKTYDCEKIGYCSIIGVDKNFKGKGIGRKLWEEAFSYLANEKDIETCKVAFLLNNYPSFNFHLKMGFNKIEEIKYIYHYRKQI